MSYSKRVRSRGSTCVWVCADVRYWTLERAEINQSIFPSSVAFANANASFYDRRIWTSVTPLLDWASSWFSLPDAKFSCWLTGLIYMLILWAFGWASSIVLGPKFPSSDLEKVHVVHPFTISLNDATSLCQSQHHKRRGRHSDRCQKGVTDTLYSLPFPRIMRIDT